MFSWREEREAPLLANAKERFGSIVIDIIILHNRSHKNKIQANEQQQQPQPQTNRLPRSPNNEYYYNHDDRIPQYNQPILSCHQEGS